MILLNPTPPTEDEQIFADDVNCRIADCRRRLRARARSQRSTLRAQDLPPRQVKDEHSLSQAKALEEQEEALIT
jgi:hypothetical protein